MKKLIATLLLISILLTACKQPANPSVSDQSNSSDSNVSSSILSSSSSLSSNSSSSLSSSSAFSSNITSEKTKEDRYWKEYASHPTNATPEQQKMADEYFKKYVFPFRYFIFQTFESPEDLSPSFYCYFFFEHINDTYTYEERNKKYFHDGSVWILPAEELETYAQIYFDVSVEHLRSNPSFYHKEGNYYQFTANGVPHQMRRMVYEDIFIHPENSNLITFSLAFVPVEKEIPRLLTIELTDGGFRYISNIDPTEK